MDRIQKISPYLLIIFNLLLIGLPLFSLCVWLFMDHEPLKSLIAEGFLLSPVNTPAGPINLSAIHWTPLSKVINLLASFIGLLPILLGLFFLKAIFQNYGKGEIFNAYNACHYKYIGWLFFLDALIVKPLSDTLMILAVTLSNPPGHRVISISFGTPHMETIFSGILVIVMSWVMLEGYKLQEEQKFVI
jgi:hypothetical protein